MREAQARLRLRALLLRIEARTRYFCSHRFYFVAGTSRGHELCMWKIVIEQDGGQPAGGVPTPA